MPRNIGDKIKIFNLYGNGVLPQIEIVQPGTKLPDGSTLVNFLPINPNQNSKTLISFTNSGILSCKVNFFF